MSSDESRYEPKCKYTPEQLLEAEILDLETDLRCAVRDGLHDYAKEVKAQLEQKRREVP